MSELAPPRPSQSDPDVRCDFCGQHVIAVRRVALDSGYDRLLLRHHEQYACRPCSERKDRERRGLN